MKREENKWRIKWFPWFDLISFFVSFYSIILNLTSHHLNSTFLFLFLLFPWVWLFGTTTGNMVKWKLVLIILTTSLYYSAYITLRIQAIPNCSLMPYVFFSNIYFTTSSGITHVWTMDRENDVKKLSYISFLSITWVLLQCLPSPRQSELPRNQAVDVASCIALNVIYTGLKWLFKRL